MNRNVWVYDIEVFPNFFSYTAYNVDSKEVVQYVICPFRDDFNALYKHLTSCRGHIGFNNINYDYPILHYIMENLDSGENINHLLYNKSQEIINAEFSSIPYWKEKIKQCDLYRIWHFDNKAKRTSLKDIEIALRWHKVQDLPYAYNHTVEEHQIEEILKYNLNDVMVTNKFYEITRDLGKIDLRKDISKKYNLPCISWNNGKIGENLILKMYCKRTGRDIREVRKLRSNYDRIALKDCIPNSIHFKSDLFNSVLSHFKNKIVDIATISENKSKSEKNRVVSVLYRDCLIDYGLGGCHGVTEPGIYQSDNHYIIKSVDVGSLYPNLPISYNFYISHLGIDFLHVYKNDIVDVRMNEKKKPKDKQDKSIVDGFKEGANIPFGKSKDINSFLYDPLYYLKTVVSGQLSTSVLCERLGEIPDCKLLMYNTDGLEILIPRKYESLYDNICRDWEKETSLVLEYVDYQKLCMVDVNNYLAITTDGKVKTKGRLEVDKKLGNEPAFHKDWSFRIIPLVIQEYLVKGISIEQTIYNHKDIFDFCGRFKATYGWHSEIRYIEDLKEIREKQQKTNRYYISTNGDVYYKVHTDGREEAIDKGYKVTIFNNYIDKSIEEYQINYKYYIRECYKILDIIESKQLKLF